jgi:hypothetical protein
MDATLDGCSMQPFPVKTHNHYIVPKGRSAGPSPYPSHVTTCAGRPQMLTCLMQ